ncbi:MAG: TonB-dependent receptor [Pseudomonadota bacterium]
MKKLMLFTALASGVAAIAPANAQTAAGASSLDVITVTAQRREESAQDVGLALTVLSGDDLIKRGVSVVNTLEYFTPNLEIESQFGSAQASFSIRGVGFRDYATNNTPTVGVYVDDVAYPVPVMTQGVLFDVDRVEVLRGPQGTLYGRNTTGGAIKIITKRPTNDFEAGFTTEYGRFEAFSGEGYVSGPLSDNIRARLSAATKQGGSWQINRETGEELGDQDIFSVRGQLEADVTDKLSALLSINGFQDQSDGLGLRAFRSPSFGPSEPHTGRFTSWGPSGEFATAFGLAADQKPFKDNEGIGGSLTLEYSFGPAELTYIGAYQDLDRREYNDYDASTLGAASAFFESDVQVMSHEARLQSTTDSPFQWIAGLYYAEEELDEIYRSDFVEDGINGLAVFTPYSQEVETIGVFAQADYQITPLLKLIAGARYEDEERDLMDLGTFVTNVAFADVNFANNSTDGTLEDRSQSLSEVTWKAGVEATPTDDLLLFATVSKGIKSGGFTTYNTLNPSFVDPFDEEELLAYEIGFKSEFADGKVRLNGAAFYYDYDNQQVQSAEFAEILVFGIAVPIGRIVNAEESEIYGGELELAWIPVRGLEITQSFAYKEGEFEDFVDLDIAASSIAGTAVSVDRTGQSLGFPEITYQGSISYTAPVDGGFYWSGLLDYSYRDETTPPLLGSDYTVDDYWLINGQVAFGAENGRWEAAIWGRNILDEEYDEVRNFFTPGFDVAAPGLPRTYGVRLSVKY